MSKRQVKQELEQDEFIEFSHKLGEWLNANKGGLFLALCAAVVAIGAGVFVRQSSTEAESRRLQSFTMALADYAAGLSEFDQDKRRETMARAEKAFEEFAGENSGALGRRALYMAGNAWFNRGVDMKNYEEAKKLFEQCLNQGRTSEERARALVAIGYCHESMAFLDGTTKHADQALESYRKAASEAGETWMAYEARLAAARVLSARGREGDEIEALKLIAAVKKMRAPEPPANIFAKGADLSERERELLTEAITLTSQAGLAKSAELLEMRIRGSNYDEARAAASAKDAAAEPAS